MGFTCYPLGLKKISQHDELHIKSIAQSFLLGQMLGLALQNNWPKYMNSSFQIGPIQPHFVSLVKKLLRAYFLILHMVESIEGMIFHLAHDP